MKKLILVLFFISYVLTFSFAQTNAPGIEWARCLGGTGTDHATSIIATTNLGYAVLGYAYSNDGDVTGNNGSYDYWLVKLDSNGTIQWQKCLGGTGSDFAASLVQISDGGYALTGFTNSNDGDVIGQHGNRDYWVVKIDSIGNIQWQKCLGGSATEQATDIIQTNDGGYILSGFTGSNDGDVIGYHSGVDYWIVKLDSTGNIQWQKCLGGTLNEVANSIIQTTDNGYAISGYTNSTDGNVIGNHGGNDFWLIKLDISGNIQWQKCLGGSNSEESLSLKQTTDDGYVLAGYSNSTDGDVTSNSGHIDYWVVKLDSVGVIQWQKSIGGSDEERASSILQASNGGYVVAGFSLSNDTNVNVNHGYDDYWIIELDSFGNLTWQKCLGGSLSDYPNSIIQTHDEGYAVAGLTSSSDGDVNGYHGGHDYWIVKLYPDTTTGITSIPSSTSKQHPTHLPMI